MKGTRALRIAQSAVKCLEYLEPVDHAEHAEYPESAGVLRSACEDRVSLGGICSRGARGAS